MKASLLNARKHLQAKHSTQTMDTQLSDSKSDAGDKDTAMASLLQLSCQFQEVKDLITGKVAEEMRLMLPHYEMS